MSFESLQERLSALQETTSQLRELIDRLADLKFEPGSVPLDTSEEGSVSGELGAEISQLLREGEDDQELLQEEVEFLKEGEHGGRTRLRQGVERQGKELESCRISFRKARLAAKKNLVRAQRLERELVIKSYSIPASETTSPGAADDQAPPAPIQHQYTRHAQKTQQSSLSEKDRQTVGASSRATDSLRQLHLSLQGELERSDYARQTMKESSEAFKQLDDSYSSLDTMLSSSKDLLGTLMKSQKSDTWYLTTTFYMLLIVGGWLVFRRLLYGPMWWLVWFPLRILFGVGSKVGNVALQGRGDVGGSESAQALTGQYQATEDGIGGDEVPTAQVGQEKAEKSPSSDPDSMVDQVGKVVDAVREADELGSIPQEEAGEAVEVDDDQARVRDEL